MTELTNDYLIKHGFETNHPNRVLCHFYKTNNKNPEWRINIEQEYFPLSNRLVYNVNCWRCDEKGAIIKRSSVDYINTVEELNAVVSLCGIDDSSSTKLF